MRSKFVLATAVAGVLSAALAGPAQAGNVRAIDVAQAGIGRAQSDAAANPRTRGQRSAFSPGASAEEPSDPRYLPSARENFDLVGAFDVPGAFDGQIADVAVHKGWAYLNSWDDPECRRGGFYAVDIRDPANPRPGPFVPALQPYYHGEGAHAISIATPQFTGDVLAVNNETYSAPCGGPVKTGGGFDLYDVSDPTRPAALVQAAGDRAGDGVLEPQDEPRPNSYHSVFVWQDGPRAYLGAVDNTEFADVDIFDITDPRAPEQIGDYDLVELFPQIVQGSANGDQIFSHDLVVKRIGDRVVMKVDYWDAGYVQLDVTDPRAPRHITDTNFDRPDPLTGFARPEGNAHQGEFSFDNQFLLAADEDFAPYRSALTASAGPRPGTPVTVAEGNARPIATLPDGALNGPSVFVGNACDPATIPAAPADDADPATDDIALIERGGLLPDGVTACGFANKFDNAEARGWDGVVIFNQVRPDDTLVNMETGAATIPGVIMTRRDALGAAGVLSSSAATPAIGTAGPPVTISQRFDGWGYAHLYDARTSEELDAYAIEESLDPRYATGFGDLSIHEFATDPQTNVAYAAWYSGGMRAFRFSREEGLVPTGKFIEPGGSNYWGVEQFTDARGGRLIAGSDRDRGLRILRYTGPGAVLGAGGAPGPGTVPVPVPVPVPVTTLPDNRVTVRVGRYSTRTQRVAVTVGVRHAGVLSAELRIRSGGRTYRLARAVRRPTRAGSQRMVLQVTRKGRAALRAALRRSGGRTVRGTIRVAFQPRGGQYRIVNRAITGLR